MRSDGEQLEQWLDQALLEYGKVEPRAGLENRVLANVDAERVALERRGSRWQLAAVLAVATVIVLGAVWLRYGRSLPSPDTQQARIQAETQKAARPAEVGLVIVPETGARQGGPRVSRRYQLRGTGHRPPKLDRFPSPAPLSEQEKILARYISEFPEHSVLVARAQTSLLKEEERDELRPGYEDSPEQENRSEKQEK